MPAKESNDYAKKTKEEQDGVNSKKLQNIRGGQLKVKDRNQTREKKRK